MEYKVSNDSSKIPLFLLIHVSPQQHMPVLPNLQNELEDAYRKTLPTSTKK